jgi:tubulin polyglutamylase TTLL4
VCQQSNSFLKIIFLQEYIDNPFLIRGLKFDLRLYVLLTSIDPIKLYICEEGLVRFATEEYTNNPEQIFNNFIHLTNYIVNKECDEFVYNETPGNYSGHKWNLSTLWRYLSEVLCIDWRPVWEQTKEICLKTVLCGHQHIKREVASKIKSEYNCYKLLAFDVFYDANLKPWLLEVSIRNEDFAI